MLNVAPMTLTTSFKDLEVWQESMALVEDIYALSKSFPREELFGLTSQLRKAAVSIPSNIGDRMGVSKRSVGLSLDQIVMNDNGEPIHWRTGLVAPNTVVYLSAIATSADNPLIQTYFKNLS